MQSIAERGRTVMQWLIVIGIIASWACLDRSPAVIETARHLLDRLLIRPESLGLTGDPLKTLPDASANSLAMYRRLLLHPAFEIDGALVAEKREFLQQVSVGSVVELARQVLDHPEVTAARKQYPVKDILLDPIRSQLAQLEVWQQKSSLSSAATLADIEHELSTRVQIPGTDQSLGLRHCMMFLGLGIIGLHLYFTSLLMTLGEELAHGDVAIERSWILVHRAPLGPLLTMLTLALPSAAWLAHQVLLPFGDIGKTPPLAVWVIAALVGITTAVSLRQAALTRQNVLARWRQVVSGGEVDNLTLRAAA